jgi:hypothetical protein
MRFFISFVLLSSVAILGCTPSGESTNGGNTLSGKVLVFTPDLRADSIDLGNQECPPPTIVDTLGIGRDTPVVVKESNGEIVGKFALQDSTRIHATDPPKESSLGGYPFVCSWDFSVEVPESEFYVVVVNNQKEVTISAEELTKPIEILLTP